MKTQKSINQLHHLEEVNETKSGQLTGGFSSPFEITRSSLNGPINNYNCPCPVKNNCQGGNCLPACGGGQL